MRLRFKSLLSILVLIMGVLGLSASPAGAVANPEHHSPILVIHGTCMAILTHGNFYDGAYTKFFQAPNSCAFAEVRVVALKNSQLMMGAPCSEIHKDSCYGHEWYQSFVDNSTIVGSELYLCSHDYNGCKTFTYRAI